MALVRHDSIISEAKPTQLTKFFNHEADYALVPQQFDPLKLTSGLSGYDQQNADDVLETSAYVTYIFQRLYQSEVSVLLIMFSNFLS